MSLWVDKYRPNALDKLEIHEDQSTIFKQLCAEESDFPHLLIYGPSGAGKKTRSSAILKELYGVSAEKVRVEHRAIQTTSSKSKAKDLVTIASSVHIEMNPSDFGYQDRIVVTDVIKEIAQTKPLNSKRTFKVVVINEVDRLSKEAQHALRRTMELYVNNCRLIMIGKNISKVIEPLRSRCLVVRIPAPQHPEIEKILQSIAKKENVNLPTQLATTIAVQSDRNLRRAILMFEATKIKFQTLTPETQPEHPAWNDFIATIAKDMMEEQSPRRLGLVRGKLYEILGRAIPADIIFKHLVLELLQKVDDEAKIEMVQWAAFYEHRLQTGSKPIYHLEAFVARFMSVYKKFMFRVEETNV